MMLIIIFLIVLILLFSPMSLRVAYRDGKFQLHACYLFMKVNFSPETVSARASKKSKKAKREKKPKQAKKTTSQKKDSRSGSFEAIREVLPMALGVKKDLHRIRRNLVFYKVEINGRISAQDAHKAAMLYSQVTAAVSILLSVISELFSLRDYHVNISPDFGRDASVWNVSFRVRIAPWVLLRAVTGFLVLAVKILLTLKSDKDKAKDGKKYEPATSNR